MLPAWIIEDLKRREAERVRREDAARPRLELPLPPPPAPPKAEDPQRSVVIVIDL